MRDILTQPIHTPEQQKYLIKLLGFDFDIQYKPGHTNIVADALSREFGDISTTPIYSSFLAITAPLFHLATEIRSEVLLDPFYNSLLQKFSGSEPHAALYQCRDGLVYRGQRICLNPSLSLKPKVLFEFHNTPLAGHEGVRKTPARLGRAFYWAWIKM